MKRVAVTGPVTSAARPGRLGGTAAGPGCETWVPTRICITAESGGAGVTTGLGGDAFFMASVWPGEGRKSTITSARSARA
jgi:hypothetical protein